MSSLKEAMAGAIKRKRLDRNESQEVFALRVGLTYATYRRIEQADGSVGLQHWEEVLNFLSLSEDLIDVLTPKPGLLAQARMEQGLLPTRKRAAAKLSR